MAYETELAQFQAANTQRDRLLQVEKDMARIAYLISIGKNADNSLYGGDDSKRSDMKAEDRTAAQNKLQEMKNDFYGNWPKVLDSYRSLGLISFDQQMNVTYTTPKPEFLDRFEVLSGAYWSVAGNKDFDAVKPGEKARRQPERQRYLKLIAAEEKDARDKAAAAALAAKPAEEAALKEQEKASAWEKEKARRQAALKKEKEETESLANNGPTKSVGESVSGAASGIGNAIKKFVRYCVGDGVISNFVDGVVDFVGSMFSGAGDLFNKHGGGEGRGWFGALAGLAAFWGVGKIDAVNKLPLGLGTVVKLAAGFLGYKGFDALGPKPVATAEVSEPTVKPEQQVTSVRGEPTNIDSLKALANAAAAKPGATSSSAPTSTQPQTQQPATLFYTPQ